MDVNVIICNINIALVEADNLCSNSNFFRLDSEPIQSTKKVLSLLKSNMIENPNEINQRVLRAMRDLGMSAYKEFENTSLANAINNVTEILYELIPEYRMVEPLRNDFGKGYPI